MLYYVDLSDARKFYACAPFDVVFFTLPAYECMGSSANLMCRRIILYHRSTPERIVLIVTCESP